MPGPACCAGSIARTPVIVTEMVPLAEWYDRGEWFDYRGHKIWFRDTGGSRQPLLLIHGFPTASWDWHAVWPALESHYRLLAMDMIGFGYSDKPQDYQYSLADQADLVTELCNSRGITRCHLLAHDYGDTVAQELLARLLDEAPPQLEFDSVCLLNGGIIPGSHRPTLVQHLLASPLGWLVGKLLGEPRFRKTFSSIFGVATQPSDEELRACWQLIEHNNGTAIMHKLIRYMQERKKHRDRWVGALQHTDVPLRLIDGGADPISGAHMVKTYRELIPDPDVVLLEEIGHYPQLEAAECVIQGLLAFHRGEPS